VEFNASESNLSNADLAWISKTLGKHDAKITVKRVKKMVTSEEPLSHPKSALIKLLVVVEIKAQQPHSFVFLDGNPFLQQPLMIREAILKRLSDKIVFIFSSNHRQLNPTPGIQQFFISDGQRVVMTVEGKCADRIARKLVAQKLGLDASIDDIAMQDHMAAGF
jgi:hypothetical protein